MIIVDGKYVIEFIEYMGLYRLYENRCPEQTCAYCESVGEAMELIEERERKK